MWGSGLKELLETASAGEAPGNAWEGAAVNKALLDQGTRSWMQALVDYTDTDQVLSERQQYIGWGDFVKGLLITQLSGLEEQDGVIASGSL